MQRFPQEPLCTAADRCPPNPQHRIGNGNGNLEFLTFQLPYASLRLFHIAVAQNCKLELVPRAISFEFAAGYLTPAPNEEVLDDYDDDVLLAQIIVVDDDPLDDGSSSELMTPQGPLPEGPDSRATIAP